MTLDASSGVWSYTAADASWTDSAYYTYDVKVFSRAGNAVATNAGVTDPYAPSLNGNGRYGMVLNLADAAVKPAGWQTSGLPASPAPTDSVIYELHVRDFSASDAGSSHPGKFLAFTDTASAGYQHLAALAAAGLTHVHLLPSFDFNSVDELNCQTPVITPASGASLTPETAVTASQNTDCYNWGYDPAHYGAPEGSYSSNADDGVARVLEFRQMVAALHALNLHVVMDVVYNHTASASVLDQIVPGYYYRLDANGNIENASCCADTATEFAMMSRLMRDTLVTWTDQYKVDGFRFDIMGFIPLAEMQKAQSAVNTIAAGDGRGSIYFYGEGWNFGPVANDALFVQARQANLAGTGIGSFNDRIRDSVRGGGPFDSGASMVANQGFINGACYDTNAANNCSVSGLQVAQNLIRLSLAGNVKSFTLNNMPATSYLYGGQPAAYTQDPTENIAYVSVHDNETLFDVSQYKHPVTTSTSDRARAQVVGLSTVLLAQGVPFIHAGDDLLRSKSMDSNSYNSGDYFNKIDWTGATDNWAVGAPPQNTGNNAANLATMTPLLNNVAIAPMRRWRSRTS
jgi:pullulanase-type alpha-1,6-glucosidase